MQSVASHLELDEVVSPELVLVDPELAQTARRRLREMPEWRPQTPPRTGAPLIFPVPPPIALAPPPVVVRAPAPRKHRPLTRSILASAIPLSLLAALVLAMVVSEVQAQFQDPVASLEPVPVAPPPPARVSAGAQRAARPETSTPTQLPTTREVEMRTLALLADGATAAPPALLDDRPGRLANNVWIACRRVGQTARFTCKLGAGPSSSREWFLTVAVARDGTEVLTWEPTRMAH
jgi:hypothetical protein